jgi:uncharacterized protein (TIGR00369 family)
MNAMFSPADDRYQARVRESFERQLVMATIGGSLVHVAPGEVDIRLAFRPELTQQHGFLHAGIVATIADSACGYAAYSLMPAEAGVLSIEYKINLLAPAQGDAFVARGRVIRAGKTITVCRADVVAAGGAGESLVATMVATMMTIRDRTSLRG